MQQPWKNTNLHKFVILNEQLRKLHLYISILKLMFKYAGANDAVT